MKKLLLILICLFVYSPSYSKWEKLEGTSEGGHSLFIDIDRIRVKGDNVFYWELHNFIEEIGFEKSQMVYIQGHCEEFKFKVLKGVGCLEPMGRGDCIDKQLFYKNLRQWEYPTPYSVREITLNKVCKLR